MNYKEFRFRWVSWISSQFSVVRDLSFDWLIFILVMLHGPLTAHTCKVQWRFFFLPLLGKENVEVLFLHKAFLFKKGWMLWKFSALKFKVINVRSALKFCWREHCEVQLKCIKLIQRIARTIEIRNLYNLAFLIGFLRWNKMRMLALTPLFTLKHFIFHAFWEFAGNSSRTIFIY